MNILHAISGLGGGGAENLLVDVAAELQARGVRQRVLFYSGLRNLEPRLQEMGIDTHFIDHAEKGFLRSVRETRAQIDAFAPDVLHTHLIRADLIGRTAGLSRRGLPCFTTIHNMDAWREEKGAFSLALGAFDRITVNHVRRTQLVAVAECCRQYCIKHTRLRPEKIVTIPNFTASRPEKWGSGVTRASLGFSPDDFVFVNVGRLEPQKCQMDIIECAAWLRGQGVTDIRFLILGEGELRTALEEAVRAYGVGEQVRLEGFVRNVYDYFAISDAFLLTSAFEGAPIVLLEAFHNGLAAVVSDIPATREMIADGAGAVSYPLHDVEALGERLLAIRAGDVDLASLSETARAYESRLTPQRYVDSLLRLYASRGVVVPRDVLPD